MASNPNYCDITPEIMALAQLAQQNSSIDPDDYVRYDVKRGLRDLNGKGVLAGLTEISDIVAKKMVNGEEIPCDGKLYSRKKAEYFYASPAACFRGQLLKYKIGRIAL